MGKVRLFIAFSVVALGLAAAPLSASGPAPIPEVQDWAKTDNMTAVGYSPRQIPLTGTGSGVFNSDLAFWGDWVIQGHYSGFRIIDVTKPSRPKEVVNYANCVAEPSANGSQGDIVVWGHVLVRSWDAPRAATAPRQCGEVETPANQEGVHIFDISDPTNPVVVKFIQTPCGSHTATGVPDLANNRLLVYSSASSGAANCRGLDILEVPLNDLAASSYLRFEPSGTPLVGEPNRVTIDAPSSAAGTYDADGSAWHPDPTPEGVTAPIVLVNDGSALPTQGCGPLVGFPAGSIALVDRGTCTFLQKAQNAEAAGAVAVIVVNNVAGAPTQMGGDSHTQQIPSVMVSQADGELIKTGLPATGTVKRAPGAEDLDRPCHDTAVILGDAMRVACAGGNGVSSWSLKAEDGGSLTDPALLYSENHGTGVGHTAAFTYDGEMIVFGHEPGGGGQAQCQATSSEFNRTLWFLDADTGMDMGEFLHPRPQTATENCTWHNLNLIPLKNKNGKPRYVFVSGNYQSGISVVDFSDPENAQEIAFVDPPPLSATTLIGGGDWSTYWYNGRIYQSDMKRGLFIWRIEDDRVATYSKQTHSNPQTLEFTIGN